jgi:hypothetical protein
MAIFIRLTRSLPPKRRILVNVDRILLVFPGSERRTVLLFEKEHTMAFEERPAVVEKLIAGGPYVITNPPNPCP